MHYLFKHTQDNKIVYSITDYKEVRPDGKFSIVPFGWVDAVQLFCHESKEVVVSFGKKLIEHKQGIR